MRDAARTIVWQPGQTDRVFELIELADRRARAHLLRRFRRAPHGVRLLRERPRLLDALRDCAHLGGLPEASFGRTYLAFMERAGIEAGNLVRASRVMQGAAKDGAEAEWVFQRTREAHDLWHVLTGYGRGTAGEAAMMAFSHGACGLRGLGLIGLGAALAGPKRRGLRWQRELLRAWRRGRRARALVAAPFEEWLALPLEEVRARLTIEPPLVAHPRGVVVERAVRAAGRREAA